MCVVGGGKACVLKKLVVHTLALSDLILSLPSPRGRDAGLANLQQQLVLQHQYVHCVTLSDNEPCVNISEEAANRFIINTSLGRGKNREVRTRKREGQREEGGRKRREGGGGGRRGEGGTERGRMEEEEGGKGRREGGGGGREEEGGRRREGGGGREEEEQEGGRGRK